MRTIATKHTEQLKRIKENIDKWRDFFRENNVSWHDYRRFLYVSSINPKDQQYLSRVKKPQLEFNILEAYVARQKGEFSKQQPDIVVEAGTKDRNDDKHMSETIDVVEGYLRNIERKANQDSVFYNIYDDILSGGFSVGEVLTDYKSPYSFDQDIIMRRGFEPTLCGFDPMAQEPHKGDGLFCFKAIPYRKETFEDEFPDVDISELSFTGSFENLSWSYKNNNEDVILVFDYYEKKKKPTKIVLLSDGQRMTKTDYEKFLVNWDMEGHIEQPPQVVKEKKAALDSVVRYRLVENQIIEHRETDFRFLPLVFIGGDSQRMRRGDYGEFAEYTRPYCYQAIDVQKLKNAAGQSLAHELETMVQHKFKFALESVPKKYMKYYTNVQTAANLPYNAFLNNDPDVRLPPPEEIVRPPIPPIILETFAGADKTTQAILGSYDAALGINDNQLSGLAVIEAATQSNAAAMPGFVGFMSGLNRMAQIALDLIPKYLVTPRTIPIVDNDGKRRFAEINKPGSPSMEFSEDALNVNVTSGANFSVQQSKALRLMAVLSQSMPAFAQFISNTPEGLRVILDNIDMRGSEKLKEALGPYFQNQQKQKQEAMQQNPAMVKAQLEQKKMMLEHGDKQQKNQIDLAQTAIMDKQADTGRIKVLADVQNSAQKQELERDKLTEERARTIEEMMMKEASQQG